MRVTKAESFINLLEDIHEKWGKEDVVNPAKKGMWDGWSQEDLKAEYAKLKAAGPHDKDSAKATRMKEINFALRAKHKWGKAGTK